MRANSAIGAYGERLAVEHLEQAGYTIIDRNWRCELGEIDVVALDGTTVVVCEVKTRSGLGYGSGLEAVTPDKAARMRKLARRWLAEAAAPSWVGLRFDVVAVHRRRRGRPDVVHLQGAF